MFLIAPAMDTPAEIDFQGRCHAILSLCDELPAPAGMPEANAQRSRTRPNAKGRPGWGGPAARGLLAAQGFLGFGFGFTFGFVFGGGGDGGGSTTFSAVAVQVEDDKQAR
jgi:hypothetical protein